jgi:hypothetical protein
MQGASPLKKAPIFALIVAIAALLSIDLCAKPAHADNGWELCFRSHTNSERTSRGIPDLADDVRVDKVARDHSDRLERDGTIYHNENLSNELPPWDYAGENVGEGPDCDTIQSAFMHSASHRENLLDPDYRFVGVGVTLDSASGTIYVTLDFFTPSSVTAAAPKKPIPTTKPTPTTSCKLG